MEILIQLSQLIIVLGIFNVWFLRYNKSTNYRGGNSKSLEEEFKVYGYPRWLFYLVGVLKVTFAIGLSIGFWIETLVPIASLGMTTLMLGAIISHLKVKDSFQKFAPATIVFALSLLVLTASLGILPI